MLFGYGNLFYGCRFKKKPNFESKKHNMGGNAQQDYRAQIPGEMRSQMTAYQNSPESETARNALFQKWNEINPTAAQNFINQSVADVNNTQGYNTAEGANVSNRAGL